LAQNTPIAGSPAVFNIDQSGKWPILLTCMPGLEDLVSRQICAEYPQYTVSETRRGKVFLRVCATIRDLCEIRCADNLYLLLREFEVGRVKEDLAGLSRAISGTDFAPLHALLPRGKKTFRVAVSASRSGDHTYSRYQAAEAALQALLRLDKTFAAGSPDDSDINFRLDIVGNLASFSMKLTTASFRYRGGARMFMPGAIRPSIANVMVWLSQPNDSDIFLDPFCGSGTIVSEREHYAAGKIFASDLSDEAVAATKNNVSPRVVVTKADACRLRFQNGAITTIVTNLPWDVQVRAGEGAEALYADFLRSAHRVMARASKMIVLTGRERAWEDACVRCQTSFAKLAVLSLHGLHPALYQVEIPR
jgi:23S rRNA G2445 N2-methylase RlmL